MAKRTFIAEKKNQCFPEEDTAQTEIEWSACILQWTMNFPLSMNFPCRDKSCEWSAMLAVNSLYAIGVNWSHVLGPRFLISAVLTGAKDCLPPGVEVPGRVAEPFDCLKRESFQRLPAFYSASVKIRCQAKTKDEKNLPLHVLYQDFRGDWSS